MSEVQVSCATCRFWEEQSKCCRRYAPHPTLGDGEHSDERRKAFWVLTNAEDWCGDYESILGEDYEEEERPEEEEEEEEWEADGSPKWSPPPPAPPAQRGLFR